MTSSERNSNRNGPRQVGLVLVALLAGGFAFLMPPFQMPDEHSHFLRAYLISRGEIVAVPGSHVPDNVRAFVERYPDAYEFWCKGRPFEGLWTRLPPETGESPITESPLRRFLLPGVAATGTNFPLAYLPASTGIWVARLLGAPPQVLFYVARLSGTLAFLAAVAIAMRLAPHWRTLILAVALLPMALHQAGAISADSAQIAFSFVGFGLAMWARERTLTPWHLAFVGVYFVAWSMCKFSLWCLPMFWVAAMRSVSSAAERAVWTGAVVIVTAAATVGWQHINAANVEHFRIDRLSDDTNTAENVRIALHNPVALLHTSLYSIRIHFIEYIGGFIGKFGWFVAGPPAPVRFGYLAALLFAAFTAVPEKQLFGVEKLALFTAAVTGVGLLFAILIIYCAPIGFLEHGRAVGTVQGRYFIPFALPGLSVLGLRRVPPTIAEWPVLAAAFVCGILSLRFVWSLYYV